MNTKTNRREFEEWANLKKYSTAQFRDLDEYVYDDTTAAWEAWQAAKELPQRERDEARSLAEKYRYLSCDSIEKADETLLPWEITANARAMTDSDTGWERYIETGNEEELLTCSRRIECERDDLRRQLETECRSWNTLTSELAEIRLENQLLRRGILPEKATTQTPT
jgi:hypothetical protein